MKKLLIDDGWKKYLDKRFYKEFDCTERCMCNNERKGIQITVCYQNYEHIEISITAKKPDGVWIKLSSYAILLKNFTKVLLENQVRDLIAAWKASYYSSMIGIGGGVTQEESDREPNDWSEDQYDDDRGAKP
jgi:hypothetical protein